jgi:hypothetical protein
MNIYCTKNYRGVKKEMGKDTRRLNPEYIFVPQGYKLKWMKKYK